MKFIPAALLASALLVATCAPARVAHAACDAGQRIDGSTAAWAKRQLEAANFRGVRNLKKGCDNFWHGTATRGGVEVGVSLSPAGAIVVEEKGS